jgi:hypothetical protein
MSTVAPAPPVRPVRHGLCRLTLRIGGTDYRLRHLPDQPGFRSAWTLRVLDGERAGKVYSIADPKGRGEQPGCTCPDHEVNGATCKHVMALVAHGLVRTPKAAKPRPISRAVARHAKAAIAEARAALTPEIRRHLAEIAAPAPAAPVRGTTRRAALAGLPAARDLDIQLTAAPTPSRPAPLPADHLPEGWQPGGAAGFATGLRSAVAAQVAVRRGDLIECAVCRYPFDPAAEGSAPLALCGSCLEQEGGES